MWNSERGWNLGLSQRNILKMSERQKMIQIFAVEILKKDKKTAMFSVPLKKIKTPK